MKKFLLVSLVAFPSLVLAQPTFTFTPVDAATNVSTTNDLLIEASSALFGTDGTAISNATVNDFVILMNNNTSTNVPFLATINAPGRIITVNPTSALPELTNFTLTLKRVENGAGEETGPTSITFTTGDFTNPSFNLFRGINNSGTAFTFLVNVSEGSTVYYVVDPDDSTPSAAEIKTGKSNDNSTAEAFGSFVVTANTDASQTTSPALPFPDKYFVYFLARDASGNESAPAKTGLPFLTSSSIQSLAPFQFELRVNVDEDATTYYVVTLSSTKPTATQILAGQDQTGVAAFKSGNFNVTGGNDIDELITGLDDGTQYYVHFVAADGVGNQTIIETETATTPDGTPPTVSILSPADGSATVDISRELFTITFNENISTIAGAPAGDEGRILLYEDGVFKEDINRNDATVGTDGGITTSGLTATIDFTYALLPNKNYHIIIGDEVFQDAAGNPFAGFGADTDWNFSTSGATVNNATSNICSGSFQAINSIIISENGPGDFNTGAGQTLILSLDNTSEFVISNAGVSVTGTSADITSVSVTVGLTSLTVTYDVGGTAVVDNITISGIKIYATGMVASTTIIRTGGTADQDGNNGEDAASPDYATINVGLTAPAQPQLAASQDLIHCVGENITAKTLTLVDQGAVTYKWYEDASLSTLAYSAPTATVDIVADLGMASPAVAGSYTYYVVTESACQSAPPVEVTLQVSANPVADAGADKTGVNAVCTGTQVTLGGNPTLAVPSAAGAYTYTWQYVESTPEPNAEANPVYTVSNVSTVTPANYNFEVTVTDVNGCFGTDAITVEVKPTFTPFLTSPSSSSFTPTSPNQTLVATPAGGVFSGVGVVQSGAPSTYQFSPSIAHATDPNTLPKDFDIFYTVTDNGCTVTNYQIATFTISNSFFTNLQPQYCSSEFPNPASSGVNLSLDATGSTYMDATLNNWNISGRFSRVPHSVWANLGIFAFYSNGTLVRYGNEFYRCNGGLLGCGGSTIPSDGAPWVQEDILKAEFNGLIQNYYEGSYGGNASGPTVVQSGSSYTVNGHTYPFYRFGTNANYNNCPTCNFAYPAAYIEFQRPEDIKLLLRAWFPSQYHYLGEIVTYNGNVYRCTANPYVFNAQPDLNPGFWTLVTNSDYSNGQYFHKQVSPGVFTSGYYVRGQHVQINRNPSVSFSGLANSQKVCEFDVLNLNTPSSSGTNIYALQGNYAFQGFVQEFQVRLEGSGTFNDGGGAIVNNVTTPGLADFDTRIAFEGSTGALTFRNIQIEYKVDPGTDGSTLQPCYGTSTITVQVVQNSTFDFDAIVDPEGSVYCYTDAAEGLRSAFGGSPISGPAGSANSVSYTGYGVNDLGNSLGTFTPGLAIEQIASGTTTQQSIPITALYRDANLCQSTRLRTFKVNPDIQPSFTFGGRVNYCYEDIANPFTGHFQDYSAPGTVTSTGSYSIFYRDPGGASHELETNNANNMSFDAQPLYDQIQDILDPGFPGNLNQTANINIVYTETLNAGKVCSESFSQPMVINPPVLLDIFGLNDGDKLCRNDNSNVSVGNFVKFDGSVTGAGLFSLDDDADFVSGINPTLNGTVNTTNGQASINLLNAYNAATDATDPRQVYLRYQYTPPGCTGPAEKIKRFEISPPPTLAFDFGGSPGNAEVFCYDEAPVALATIQKTNVTLSGWGVTDDGNGSGTFTPELGYNTSISNGGTLNTQQNIVVTASIIDAVGCKNVTTVQYKVNPIPQATLNTGSLYYCYEDDPRDLIGQQANSWFAIEYQGVTTPYTENIGDINANMSTITWDPAARFDDAVNNYGASALTPVDFNVYYSVADNDLCTNTIGPFTISVANQIDVSIAGLVNNDIFCSNETNGVKKLSFNPFPADASKRTFRINSQTIPLSTATYDFAPPLGGGDFTIEYIVVSGNNCTNTETTLVKVLPSPLAIFSVQPACDSALIDYNADATSNLTSAMYTWTLSDSVRTGQNLQHRFPGVSTYSVQLYVEYPQYNNDPDLVCQDSLRLDQIVGPVPDMDFEFSDVCEEDNTSFTAEPDIPISTVSWDFGDGETTAMGFLASSIPASGTTSGTYEAPRHAYSGASSYLVTVTGKTAPIFGGCVDSETKEVAILKNWAPSPAEQSYDMSALDGGKGFWVKEDVNGNATWEFSTAAKPRLSTNEMAWVTGATEPYRPNDVSYMNSPCFDLSGFSRPVLSIKHWANTDFADGAVVQYSVNGGKDWERLGNVASGLDWYNRLTISSNPGEQDDISTGWSTSDQDAWAIGKHTLDDIGQPRTQVRFRVAFASITNPEGRDGFAFNNVVIEERNRTLLVENFTNLQQTQNNALFRAFKAVRANDMFVFNPEELVKLQYHHTSAQNGAGDQLNAANPIDPNARAAFYGVTNAVRTFIDGGYGQLSDAGFGTGIAPPPPLTTYFSLRSLVTSPVDISIDFQEDPTIVHDPAKPLGPADPSTTLNVKATVQATSDLGASGHYNVFIAIAERQVLVTEPKDTMAYVLRKFLPDPAGTPLTSLSATDGPQVIYETYDMRHMTRLPNGDVAPFAVIVFVQHLETKDVLQTALRQDGTGKATIVTGIETPFDGYLKVYPNPADDHLNIILPAPVKSETPVKLFDTFGREVFNGIFKAGEYMKPVETKSMSAGVYLIHLSTPEGLVRKKAVVVHE